MKLAGLMTAALVSLTLVAVAPAFAQEQHDQDEQKAKPAQEEKKAQRKNPRSRRRTMLGKMTRVGSPSKTPARMLRVANRQRTTFSNIRVPAIRVAGASPTIASRPISDGNIVSALAKTIIAITGFNMAATGSALSKRGRATGCIRKMFM